MRRIATIVLATRISWMLCAASFVPGIATAFADEKSEEVNPVGAWRLKFSTADGKDHAPLVKVSREKERLKVEYESQTPAADKLVVKSAEYNEGGLIFTVVAGDATVTFRGKIEKDAIRGEANWEYQGQTGTFEFAGLRAEQVARAATDPAAVSKPAASPATRIKVPEGFQVELLYSVPKETQGSWVNMAVDPKGRLIVSDQYGGLYRVTLPPAGEAAEKTIVEPIDVKIGEAQGLLWAFDSLYVVVNRGKEFASGLYRIRDTDGDDRLDQVESLRTLEGNGEHGPHGIVLAPDGKSLYFVAGNSTQLPAVTGSLVPRVWGEDNLLPRMVDGTGFMKSEKAPGGFVCRVSPDGKSCELVSMGFRNSFDLAFNRAGELFTYDSDMEWDVNTPWYRPTRVLHVTSGSEFGYRNGAGKWPPYYIDSLPAVANVGPGSPTGVAFGYGAKFPAKYQEALYLCDWSYGKLYALHLAPRGATYGGELEEFATGTPLALTDVVINPHDGAMYFTVGGRKTQSGLYRVRYTGPQSTAKSEERESVATVDARKLRHTLEASHGRQDPLAVEKAWPYLGHADRFVRWAARTAILSQPVERWRDRALAPSANPQATLNGLLALVQASAQDPAHRAPDAPATDPALRDRVLGALGRIGWTGLTPSERLDLVRVYQVVLNRMGAPDEAGVKRLIDRFSPLYPARARELNVEISQLLVFLQAPDAAEKTVALLDQAPTQEEQIEYARVLRVLKSGWTPALREQYFSWFLKAARYHGGNSFPGFMANIRADAEANLSDEDRVALKPILEAKPPAEDESAPLIARPLVKAWTLDELVPLVETGLKARDFDQGRRMFAVTRCFSCHRFADEGGGLGPELTGLAGRFSPRDILESIIAPSKVISDQYATVTILTTAGKVVTGKIVNLNDDSLSINPDMLAPNKMVSIKRSEIEEIQTSTVSMMPEALLNSLTKEEILDLMAYLLSRGDRENSMFQGAKK
jgi:putative heme-binding domain-containing protein